VFTCYSDRFDTDDLTHRLPMPGGMLAAAAAVNLPGPRRLVRRSGRLRPGRLRHPAGREAVLARPATDRPARAGRPGRSHRAPGPLDPAHRRGRPARIRLRRPSAPGTLHWPQPRSPRSARSRHQRGRGLPGDCPRGWNDRL